MKKTLLLFGATTILATSFVSCTKQEEKPKNYYGVQSDDTSGTPKEAYYALFIAIVGIIFLVGWLIKRASKNN